MHVIEATKLFYKDTALILGITMYVLFLGAHMHTHTCTCKYNTTCIYSLSIIIIIIIITVKYSL